jgi:cyanophycinase
MQPAKILILLFIISAIQTYSQTGRLLLVGGGSEKNGSSSWSTPAYRWAGEGKRVAIIGVSTGSLAPYFTQQCGAAYAKEFAVASRDSADSQVLYDTLLTYEVIFFRGGDQYDYYSLYRNTKLQDAVTNLYNSGGTICGTSAGMHILSSIVFTAQNGTAYPDDCIENPNNSDVKLADDFMNLVPGFIFDTHFAERARFGRLTAFLANYSLNKGIDITGIGMDDMTCMTVDSNMLGTVYGTGCANIYQSGSGYSLNGTKLLADTVHITQLLQGCTYNFNTHEVTLPALNRQMNTGLLEETGNYTVLASGSNKLSENQALLSELVNGNGQVTDSVVLLTGNETLANTFKDKLIQLGVAGVNLVVINQQSGTDPELVPKISSVPKILFLANSSDVFLQFLNSVNGIMLHNKVHGSGMISAFVGDDSRYAGKTVVDNYYELYASYYSELTFSKGLSLLRHSIIMPNTFYNSDMYENSATAVPYAMALDTLKYGIWLTNHNFMKYTPVDGKAVLTGYGAAPVMVIKNSGTLAGFSTQTGTGSTSTKPRMVAGFEHLELSLIDYTTPYVMGNISTAGIYNFSESEKSVISPNPVSDILHATFNGSNCKWEIIDTEGQLISKGISENRSIQLDVSFLVPGLYFFKTQNQETKKNAVTKFIKN